MTDTSIVKMGLTKTTVMVHAVTGVSSVMMANAYINGSGVMALQGTVLSMKTKWDVVCDNYLHSRFQPFGLLLQSMYLPQSFLT